MLAQGKQLEEDVLFRIYIKVADAYYAHNKKGIKKGVAHRGIKLNNIEFGKRRPGDIECASFPFWTLSHYWNWRGPDQNLSGSG